MPQRSDVAQLLGPQGTLTGGADLVWTGGSAVATTLLNRSLRAQGSDRAAAVVEILVGGIITLNLAAVKGPEVATLRNVALGTTIGGLTYLFGQL